MPPSPRGNQIARRDLVAVRCTLQKESANKVKTGLELMSSALSGETGGSPACRCAAERRSVRCQDRVRDLISIIVYCTAKMSYDLIKTPRSRSADIAAGSAGPQAPARLLIDRACRRGPRRSGLGPRLSRPRAQTARRSSYGTSIRAHSPPWWRVWPCTLALKYLSSHTTDFHGICK